MRVVDWAQLGHSVSIMVEWIYIDAVKNVLWFWGDKGWHSEPLVSNPRAAASAVGDDEGAEAADDDGVDSGAMLPRPPPSAVPPHAEAPATPPRASAVVLVRRRGRVTVTPSSGNTA